MSSPYLQYDAFLAILARHRCEALNRLIMGDLTQFDPTIGDAGCAMRPSFVLDMYWRVQNYLESKNEIEFARETVRKYNGAHNNDKSDTKIRTLEDLENDTHSSESDMIFSMLSADIGEENLNLLGLCYSLTVSNTFSLGEFGEPFYYRSTNVYRTSTKEAEDRKDSGFLYNHIPRLRCDLAKACVAYFTDLVAALPCNNGNRAVICKAPALRDYIEEQLQEAVHWMRSCVVQGNPGQHDIELVAIYPQFHAVLQHEFNRGRSIVVAVRRVQINAIVPETLTYSLSDARALYFEIDKDSGAYKLSRSIASEKKRQPCLVFNCWSTYLAETGGAGLSATDNGLYFDALSQCDLSWLMLTYAAAHRAFTTKAEGADPDYGPIYQQICGPIGKVFEYSRMGCAGFNLKQHEPTDERPSLCEEWEMASQLALDHKLLGAQLLPMGAQRGQCYTRIDRPVDFSVEHVKIWSLEQAQTYCKKLKARHAGSNQATIGQFVVRIGNVGVSCTDKVFANHLSGMWTDKRRKAKYSEKYPNNLPFLASFKPFE
ncbi:MAG: hypothetical protein M1840_001248 [Geoglossum simile]|nr:MAG: hypothetical protein M1840_001248 [Geoglossum simile]